MLVLFGGLTSFLPWIVFLFAAFEYYNCEEMLLKKHTWTGFHCPPVSQLSLCMYSICMFPVFTCVCKREHRMEREAKCVCVRQYACVCQRSDVIGVSCLTPLEEAGSVECGGPPVSPVFSQAPAHENLFRWIQYCHLNRYQPPSGHLSQSKSRSPQPPSQPLQQLLALTLSLTSKFKA